MANPAPRRNAATELERRLSSGLPVEPKDVVDLIDQPMIHELGFKFGSALSLEEREGLARDVIVKLLESPKSYDSARSSLVHYAKLLVRTKALDYLGARVRTRKQQRRFVEHGLLKIAPAAAPGPTEQAEDEAALAEAIELVQIELMRLPPEQCLAAEAYKEHGPKRYAAIVAKNLGVSPNLVSQWFTRAKRRIKRAVGSRVTIFE